MSELEEKKSTELGCFAIPLASVVGMFLWKLFDLMDALTRYLQSHAK